jgi:ABC-type amino acid transport substrate-binding protein
LRLGVIPTIAPFLLPGLLPKLRRQYRDLKLYLIEDQTERLHERLLSGEVSAFVFDSPTILYYARNKGEGKVSVVGPLFDIQYYGFLFPQGSELRESVNRALLKLRTNGTYDKLYYKWFGSD